MAGRRPVPTAQKIIRGNPGRRPINENEPVPPAGKVACPSWLPAEGKKAFRELVKVLGDQGMKVLTTADRLALTLLCDAFATYRQAQKDLEMAALDELLRKKVAAVEAGRDVEDVTVSSLTYESPTPTGTIVRPRPEVAIAAEAWRRVARMLLEFGLTPAARSKVAARVKDNKEHNPWTEF